MIYVDWLAVRVRNVVSVLKLNSENPMQLRPIRSHRDEDAPRHEAGAFVWPGILFMLVLLGTLACDSRYSQQRPAASNTSEDDHIEEQIERYDAQLQKGDEQFERAEALHERYEAILAKWESQAERLDRILDRREEIIERAQPPPTASESGASGR